MNNAVSTYNPGVCRALNTVDSIGNFVGQKIPVGASFATGIGRMVQIGFRKSTPMAAVFSTAINYWVAIPASFLGVMSGVKHELYTGCSAYDIAAAKGISDKKAQALVNSYLELNGY